MHVVYGTAFDVGMTLYESGEAGLPIFGASIGVGLGVILALLEQDSLESLNQLPEKALDVRCEGRLRTGIDHEQRSSR